ncbi:uncharacterized protein LOC144155503 isoform X2 [Haemaphysalis longicornis]
MAVSDNVLRLKLDLRCAFPRPNAHDLLWIAVDQSTTTTIKELSRFIRAKYGLKKCELYFEDAWLSPQEPIQILVDKDIVRVVSRRKGPRDPAFCGDGSLRAVQDESPVTKKQKKRASEGSADITAFVLDEEADPSLETTEWPQVTHTFHNVHTDISQSHSSPDISVELTDDIVVEDSTKKCKQHPKKKKPEADVEVTEEVRETQAQEKHIVISSGSEEVEEWEWVELEPCWKAGLVTTSARSMQEEAEAVAQHGRANSGGRPVPADSTVQLPFENPPDEDAVEQSNAQKVDFKESFEEAAPATKTEDDPPKGKDYSCYPRLKSPPEVGAVIAFKLLRTDLRGPLDHTNEPERRPTSERASDGDVLDLDYYYRATVSDYKEGKVVRYSSVNGMIRIELKDAEARNTYRGSRGLGETEGDLPPKHEEVELLWTELIEPVMLL